MSFSRTLLNIAAAVRRELANAANYSTAGSVIATQTGDKVRFDYVDHAAVLARRETLTADRTYFVRTDGSNSNTGLANTAAGAFLTVQGALDAIKRIDFGGHAVTVDVQTGTYAGQAIIPSTVGQANPADLLITSSSGGAVLFHDGFIQGVVVVKPGARARLGAVALTGGGGTALGIQSLPRSTLELAGIQFGAGLLFGVLCDGGYIDVVGNYSVTAGGGCHVLLETGGYYRAAGNATVTLTGTPNFSSGFINASDASLVRLDSTNAVGFSGAATGQRYVVQSNAVIKTNGGGASYLPGDAAGSASSGGLYS